MKSAGSTSELVLLGLVTGWSRICWGKLGKAGVRWDIQAVVTLTTSTPSPSSQWPPINHHSPRLVWLIRCLTSPQGYDNQELLRARLLVS